jgi:hypothetical protein
MHKSLPSDPTLSQIGYKLSILEEGRNPRKTTKATKKSILPADIAAEISSSCCFSVP